MYYETHGEALDLFALLDQLGVKQFKAIGVSMGAKTLLHMSTQQITRIEAMVLVSAVRHTSLSWRAMAHTEAE